ncbi:TIGR00730 family Rossman fold protein [Parathalassolituus penaei]|uniref:Cytokinin riboside 5'-monophosphate phosphoribohydrolase n=1 Tax=Parathalassolituus penaei TaxID=2997323 RepID=A0A9X3IUI7_9GAMM|nr:TIGR00730 family Rossman fold protein [Parathalassolituus penaei]MCY0966999.1 TIGR00730 family Rossman fold protein [Parathalassolituus penaei]
MIRTVAIYCGSRPGVNPAYATAAAELATRLAEAGIGIVYGGSKAGLMGIVADAALAAGGEVIGVMPDNLAEREHGHKGLTRFHLVRDMHQRKAMMADLADAFIALPGGIGTLDELMEIWCWAGLGNHQKACICYDVEDYWQPLYDLLKHVHQQGFAWTENLPERLTTPKQVLALLRQEQPED